MRTVSRRARKKLALVPNLITLCNAACGFTAIIKVCATCYEAGPASLQGGTADIDWSTPAWFVLLGMVFDAFDGKIARMVKASSDFGGELDSLCDAVSFGIAPAVIVAIMNATFFAGALWGKAAWVFSLMFALCVIVRLARFNVENDTDESAHETFKGLPCPGGAGCIVGVVLLQGFLLNTERSGFLRNAFGDVAVQNVALGLTPALPVLCVLVGMLMVSNLRYTHVVTRYFKGRKPLTYLMLLMFTILLGTVVPELAIVGLFCGYALTGPLGYLFAILSRSKAKA